MMILKVLLLLACVFLLATNVGRSLLMKLLGKLPRVIGYGLIIGLILYLIYIVVALILASLWKLFLILLIAIVILILIGMMKK